ncbi:ABC transporter substrate-binding protein [Microbacterium sp. 179-B 1A2 NHS]|uniref:ABC transporter substrate-binding protein n=1 Tax=Microbacterium sp. 179-B 1A2 NHS TaxID=3142383 RepID=UPI0039A35BD2
MSVLTRSRAAKVMGGIALVGASALVLAGCTTSSSPEGQETEEPAGFDFPVNCDEAEPASYTPEYNSTSEGPAEDLEFTIGTALPVTGNLAFLGPPEIAGTEFAAAEVNEADKGVSINLVQGDSGDTDNKAYETEIPRLLNEDATAIVGAASSGVSLQFIDQVIAAGAIQFSPANTSAAFTGYEDDGLFWRTAPSDVLQGQVLGNLIAGDGNETLGMIVLNDSYGTGLACFTKTAFEEAGGEVVSAALYNTGDTNFSAQVADVLAADPDAIALITFEEVKTIIPELVGADFPSDKMYLVDGNLSNFGEEFEPGTLTGAKGTYPAVDPESIATFRDDLQSFWTGEGNAELNDFTYAPESYDAVILLALAALEAGSAEGADVSAHLQSVSGGVEGGTKCTTYAECADIIVAGDVADYDGISGAITFNDVGDPTEATIGIFEFGEDNNNTFVSLG